MGMTVFFPLYLLFMLLYGIALTVVQTTVTTLLQERTDFSFRGRVFGLLSSMYSVFFLWVWRSSDRSQTRFLSSGSWSFQALHSYVWDVSSAKTPPNDSAAFAICL